MVHSLHFNNAESLQEEPVPEGKVQPINAFHHALLQAKLVTENTGQPVIQLPVVQEVQNRDSLFSPPSTVSFTAANVSSSLHSHDLLPIAHPEQADLSVIAEDDESERSHMAAQPDIPLASDLLHEDMRRESVGPSTSETFHSITLDSPQAPQQRKSPSTSLTRSPSPVAIGSKTFDIPPKARKDHLEDYTAPLPEIPPWHPTSIHDHAMTEPLPSLPHIATSNHTEELMMPLRDHEADLPKTAFPALPAPLPLRKSMRAPRDASMGTVTPGAALGGKRTSWLKKAREVKALEATAAKTTVILNITSGPSIPNALKRKSGDMSVAPFMGLEDEPRHKFAKNVGNANVPRTPLQALKATYTEEAPVHIEAAHLPSATAEVGQEGVLDRFKRTVEDLGARVGKSMGKSLGATAAASALAEARAAAEARVAERNYKEDELAKVICPPSPEFDPNIGMAVVFSPDRNAEKKSISMSSEQVERRLSISDLFPLNDSPSKNRGSDKIFHFGPPISDRSKESRESTTTTPPDSPSATRTVTYCLPSSPVFNKPPPVFVAPALLGGKPFTSENAFTLPPSVVPFSIPTMSVGFGARLPSPSYPKHHISIYSKSPSESIQHDASFKDNVPVWMPETQDTEFSTRFGSQSQQNQDANVLRDDNSWPLDDKLAAGAPWMLSKEDSMNGSTLPSQSHRGDAAPMSKDTDMHRNSKVVPGAFHMQMDHYKDGRDVTTAEDSDLDDVILGGKSTINLVEVSCSWSLFPQY